DLRRRPGLPEGGHIERQPERRPAVRDDADPAGFGFRGARLALLQVRRGHGETRRRRGFATPVGSVTLAAPRLIQRGAVWGGGRLGGERDKYGDGWREHAVGCSPPCREVVAAAGPHTPDRRR